SRPAPTALPGCPPYARGRPTAGRGNDEAEEKVAKLEKLRDCRDGLRTRSRGGAGAESVAEPGLEGRELGEQFHRHCPGRAYDGRFHTRHRGDAGERRRR